MHYIGIYPFQSTSPLIYPCIFYNGERQYNLSTDFFDLFGQHKEEMKELLTNPFKLIDIMAIPDNELRQYLWGGILEFVFSSNNLPSVISATHISLLSELSNKYAAFIAR